MGANRGVACLCEGILREEAGPEERRWPESRGSRLPKRRYQAAAHRQPRLCYSPSAVGAERLGGVLLGVPYGDSEGRTLSPLSLREEEVRVVRSAVVVASVQELVAPLLIVLFLAVIFLGLLFFAVVGRALRNPSRTGEDEEGERREREGEEPGRDGES